MDQIILAEFFEIVMIVCFGLSWPISVYKSWKSRTAKGKSLLFEIFIVIGYFCGIIGRVVSDRISFVLIFYVINIAMITIDICLYFRNSRLDRERETTLNR